MSITSFSGEYRWLSNFHACEVPYKGLHFPSVENAYQAEKCADPKGKTAFLHISAGEAKRLGRRVPIREDWERVKLTVMGELLRIKFSPGSDLADRLLATGEEELVEGNWWKDTFWGVCNRVGENHLGRLLMEVRTELLRGKSDGY